MAQWRLLILRGSCELYVSTGCGLQLRLRARHGGVASEGRRFDEAPQEDECVGRRQPRSENGRRAVGGRMVAAQEVGTGAQHGRDVRGRVSTDPSVPTVLRRVAPHPKASHTALGGPVQIAVGRQAHCRLPAGRRLANWRQRGPVRPGGLPEVEGGEDVALHAQ